MEKRAILQPTALRESKRMLREALKYDYDAAEGGQQAIDWVGWWNTTMDKMEWMFGRSQSVVEPDPDVETFTVHALVYASKDGSGAPFGERITQSQFNWREGVWTDKGIHLTAERYVSITCQTLALVVCDRVCRLMRAREKHGLDPWLRPEHFRYRNYKGVRSGRLSNGPMATEAA